MMIEQLDLLNIADKIMEAEKLDFIDIQFKQVRGGGRARYRTRKITIPVWVLDRAEEYQIYYVIHELSHFINYDKNNGYGHNEDLKRIEQRILKEYNITIIYSRAYPKWLCNTQGEKTCDKVGMPLTK